MEQYKLTETMQKCPKKQDLLTSINIFHVLIAIQIIAQHSLKDMMTRLIYLDDNKKLSRMQVYIMEHYLQERYTLLMLLKTKRKICEYYPL